MKLLSSWKNKAAGFWLAQSSLQKTAHVMNYAGVGVALFVFFDNFKLFDPNPEMSLVALFFDSLAGFLIIFPLLVSPYWGLFSFIRSAEGGMRYATLVFTGLIVGLLSLVYINAFYINLDAQNGLVLFFLPIYAWFCIFVFKVVSMISQQVIRKIKKK